MSLDVIAPRAGDVASVGACLAPRGAPFLLNGSRDRRAGGHTLVARHGPSLDLARARHIAT